MEQRVWWLAVPMAVIVGALAPEIAAGHVSYVAGVVSLASLLFWILAREMRIEREILTPVGIASGTGLFLFVLGSLSVFMTGETSPGAVADKRALTPTLRDAASSAVLWVLLFTVCATLAFGLMKYRRDTVPNSSREDAGGNRQRLASVSLVVVASLVTAVASQAYILLDSGGLSLYVEGIATRSSFLTSKAWVTFTYIPLQISLVYLMVLRRARGLGWDFLTLLSLAALAVCTLLGGGRAALLLGVILPLILLKQSSSSKFRMATVGVGLIAMVVVATGYSVFIRDSQFGQASALVEFREHPVREAFERIAGGSETKSFDSLIRLSEVRQEPGFEYQRGETYLASPAWLIPRSVWASKPLGGANTWFTKNYVPRFYGPDRIETSISAVGEGYANFGLVGVAGAGLVFGWIVALITRCRNRLHDIAAVTLAITLSPRLFSLLRGDAFQNVALMVSTVLFVYLLRTVSGVAAARTPREQADR